MSIKAQVKFFRDILDDESVRDKLEELHEHEIEFNPIFVSEIIRGATIKLLKGNGFMKKQYTKHRNPKMVRGKLVTKTEKKPFEVAPGDTAGELIDAILVKRGIEVAEKCYSDAELSKAFTKAYSRSIDFDNGKTVLVPGAYGEGTMKKGVRQERFAQIAEFDLLQKAVKEMLSIIDDELSGTAESLRGDFSAANPKDPNVKRHLTGDTGTALGKYADGLQIPGTSKNYKNEDGVRGSLLNFTGVDAHTGGGTVAIMKLIKGLNQRSIAGELKRVYGVGSYIGGYAEQTKDRLNNYFGQFNIDGKKFTDLVGDNATLEDKVKITIAYQTQKRNRQMNPGDEDTIRKFLEKVETEQLKRLNDHMISSGRDRRSKAYRDTKASPKTYAEREEDLVIDIVNESMAKEIKKGKTLKATTPKKRTVKERKSQKKKNITIGKKKAPRVARKTKGNIALARAAKEKLAGTRPRTTKSKVSPKMAEAAKNPMALANLLNKALPKAIAQKMSAPALVYRTGRFAQSAEVTDVSVGPRGGTFIDYTYMKEPYQTFEPGFAQGSTQRDPRKIIGESVREVAQSIIGKKFLRVRRV